MDAPGLAHVTFGLSSLVLGVGVFSLAKGTALHRAVGALYVFSMFGMGWSYVGLLAATGAEITVRVVHWSFSLAVAAPTIIVTLLGGAVVQGLERRTMRQLGANRPSHKRMEPKGIV